MPKFPLVTRSHHEEVVAMKDAQLREKDETIRAYMQYIGILPRPAEKQESTEETKEVFDPIKPYAMRRLSVAKREAEKLLMERYREKHGISDDLSRVEAEGRASARGN